MYVDMSVCERDIRHYSKCYCATCILQYVSIKYKKHAFQSGCFNLLMLNPDIILSTYIGHVQQIVNPLYLGPCNKHYIIYNMLLINIRLYQC